MQQKNKLTLYDHFIELKTRILRVVLVLVVATIAGFILRDSLISIISRPLDLNLYYTTPMGGFMLAINISLLFGILVATPAIVYHLGHFIAPAFRSLTPKRLLLYVIWSFNLALAGAMFAYFISFPAALNFLTDFSPANIIAIITAEEYIRFAAIYIGGFALIFQLPLLIFIFNHNNPLKPQTLLRVQKPLILICFIIAALITPTPDPLNQAMLAMPPIVLFYISILLVHITNKLGRRLPVSNEEILEPKRIPITFEDSLPFIVDTSWHPTQPGQLIIDIR